MDQTECPSPSSAMGGQRVETPRGSARSTDSNEEDNGSTPQGPDVPESGTQDLDTKDRIATDSEGMEPAVKNLASPESPELAGVVTGSPRKSDTQHGSISRTTLGRAPVALAVAVAVLAVVLSPLQPWPRQDTAVTAPPWLSPHMGALNIAVAGAAGNGKSTLINTLRGISDDESEAALTGDITVAPQYYPWHAFNETVVVQLWDLPGAGTEEFPEQSYCEDMGLRWFDAVLIVVSRRIREVDTRILQHLQEHRIRPFVMRAQVNHDIASQKRKGISEEQTLKAMRDRMVKELNIASPYLVSGLLEHQSDLDFPKLMEDLMLFANESQSSR